MCTIFNKDYESSPDHLDPIGQRSWNPVSVTQSIVKLNEIREIIRRGVMVQNTDQKALM